MNIKNYGSTYIFSDEISKTNSISYIKIIEKQSKFDLIKLKIAAKMLNQTTANLSKEEFAITKAENYDLSLNIASEDLFNYIILEHNVHYIDSKYASELNFSDVTNLFDDYMANRNLKQSDFNQVIKTLKVEIEVLKNDYTKYAKRLLRDQVYQNDLLYLSLEDYEGILNEVKLEDIQAYISGFNVVKEYVLHKTNGNEQTNYQLIDQNLKINRYEVNSEFARKNVEMNIDQAKVNIAYKLNGEYSRELISIFNLIFGGDSFSKLFINVREKHSICYSINSQAVNRDYIHVQTGVNQENIQKVIDLIDHELEQVRSGNIKEFNNAKDKLISLYKAIDNDYRSRKNLVERNILYNEKSDIDTIIAKINEVNEIEVVELSRNLVKIKELIVK